MQNVEHTPSQESSRLSAPWVHPAWPWSASLFLLEFYSSTHSPLVMDLGHIYTGWNAETLAVCCWQMDVPVWPHQDMKPICFPKCAPCFSSLLPPPPPTGSVQFISVQSLFATPWIAARQASLSITNSRSSLKLMSIESVMPSSHLILCRPLLLLPPIPPSVRVFSNETTFLMRWPKYWSFRISIISSKEHSDLISFRMDWLDPIAVQGTQESSPTLQFKSISSSVLSFLHSPTLTSIHDHWKNHSLD